MINFLRNFFAPTAENRGVPVCLSAHAFVFYVLIGAVVLLTPLYTHRLQLASISSLISFSKNEIIALANNSRAAAGLPALQENEVLDSAAAKKAQDMLNKQYFAHISPDGKTPWFFIKNEGYKYSAAGENLAVDYVNAADANAAFMQSPSHRANILSPLYTQIGVAAVKGVFENRESTLIVQFFGKPSTVGSLKLKVESDIKNQTNNKTPADVAPKDQQKTAQSSVINIQTKANFVPTNSGEVLGEKTENFISLKAQGRIIAWIILGLALIATAFLFLRGGIITIGLIARVLVLLMVFGYIFFFGVKTESLAKIQPVAQSILELSR